MIAVGTMQAPEDQGKLSNGEDEIGPSEHSHLIGGDQQPPQQQINPPPEVMNGHTLPPQQVYISSAPAGVPNGIPSLECQFLSLQVDPENTAHAVPNIDGADDNGEQEEDEEEAEPIKLFIGQVPKSMSEEDIFPTFNAFGPLKDVAIIRDKHSGLHRGCAFVTYWSAEDADSAVQSLHDQFTFPGGRRPTQVKPAEPTVPENKLFIGMLSREATEDDVKELFEPYGEVRETYLIRNSDGSSKCAAFLRYEKRESAIKAMNALHDSVVMEGAQRPLIVKFADNNKHRNQRQGYRTSRRDGNMMHMGPGVPPYPGFHPNMPPQMGMPYPHPAHQHGMPPYPGPYGPGTPQGPGPHQYAMYPPFGPPPYAFQGRQEMQNHISPRPREGPAGANLFVYHLPHDLTDADLATAFNPFGNVVSAKVYVDKYTGESKGFGFVSYDSVMAAESAIEQMNGFQIGNKRLKVQHKRVNSHGMQPPQPAMGYPISPP